MIYEWLLEYVPIKNEMAMLIMKTKKQVLLLSLLIACFACSAPKQYEDPQLGEFGNAGLYLNLENTNTFDERLFCREWTPKSIILETYEDGIYKKSENVSSWIGESKIVLHSDYTLTSESGSGVWLYSHNYLLWRCGNNYHGREVIKVDNDSLVLREEVFQEGVDCIPYYKSVAGIHAFMIYEYQSK